MTLYLSNNFILYLKGYLKKINYSACLWHINIENIKTDLANEINLISFESNFFNLKTKLWTSLKASIEGNEYEKTLTLVTSNLKNDILISSRSFLYDLNRKSALKFFFFLLICIYSINEGFQVKDLMKRFGIIKGLSIYFCSFENLLDTSIIVISLCYINTVVYNYFIISKLSTGLIRFESEFFSLDLASNLELILRLQCNLMIFFSFLKALNLLKFNPKTYLITDTLSFSFIDLSFLVIFVLVNYSLFGIIGYGLFFIDPQFINTRTAIHTSISSIVRHIDFDLLTDQNFTCLFIWQILIWFYVQRTLINFVISIIIANFNQVRINHKKTKTEKTFSRIVKSALQYFNFKE